MKNSIIENEIIFVSLANTGLFETYPISSMEEIEIAYDDFGKKLHEIGYDDTDIELQVSKSNIGINDNNVDFIEDFYRLKEEYQHIDIYRYREYSNNI